MASTATSRSSVPSSPVRFDSPTPAALRPQPLRIPQNGSTRRRVSVDGSGVAQSEPPAELGQHSFQDERHTGQAKSIATQSSVGLRNKTSKLGSLVSKFEILDAMNNAGLDSYGIPRLSKINLETGPRAVARAPTSPVSLPRETILQSTPSLEKSSASDESSNLSPRQVRLPKATSAPRSRLPIGTRLKTVTSDALETPETHHIKQDNAMQTEDARLPLFLRGAASSETKSSG
ncbi:hypothetical protein JX265_002260 [Neoarthrinium moseri]|uniref:Uncharacterized protein n=1 Tax=Neoarthrinium moseri TaxID=1658444 RepID=A0A9P9WUQ5_9PEZI|nr:hypothetical protein JX265_002260 [Neoarthrinium moseri]